MKSETRANVIFLVSLVVAMIPGAIVISHKVRTGQSRSPVTPDPVPSFSAYMQPPPLPPNLPRVEPRVVRDWVKQQLQARLGSDLKVMRAGDTIDAGPVVSDRFVTQLVALKPEADGSLRAALLRWDTRRLSMTDPKIVANLAGRSVPCTTLRAEPLAVPVEIRHALQDVNYVDPPQAVWWMEVAIPTRRGDELPTTLTLLHGGGNGAPASASTEVLSVVHTSTVEVTPATASTRP